MERTSFYELLRRKNLKELENEIDRLQKELSNESNEERLEELSDQLFEVECYRDELYYKRA
jgi:polyhydroxyalkanoate synthesis regulator phasin